MPPSERTRTAERKTSMSSTTSESGKRTTVIRDPPSPVLASLQPTLSNAANDSEVYVTPSDGADSDTIEPRKIRIKGAKAAKILGLMREAAHLPPRSHNITLPDELDLNGRNLTTPPPSGGPSIEVHIPSSRLSVLPVFGPPSPAPSGPLPSPPHGPLPSPPSTNKALAASDAKPGSIVSETASTSTAKPSPPPKDSPPPPPVRSPSPQSFYEAHSRAHSSAASSIPDEHEALTPLEGELALMDPLPPPPPAPALRESPRPESDALPGVRIPFAPPAPPAPVPPAESEEDREEMPMGLKSARRGQLQTIQVFLDDGEEILDYYHSSGCGARR